MMAIDFRRAFDSIAFSIIKKVQKFFKFSNNLIDWIMILLEDFTVKVVQAGNISQKYALRGCRQGDPISSLLFILCIEGKKKIEDLTTNFIWKTFKDQINKKSVRGNSQRAKLSLIKEAWEYWTLPPSGWEEKLVA